MPKGELHFRRTDLMRVIKAAQDSGLKIKKITPKGDVEFATGDSEGAGPPDTDGGRPNTFDQVLGG